MIFSYNIFKRKRHNLAQKTKLRKVETVRESIILGLKEIYCKIFKYKSTPDSFEPSQWPQKADSNPVDYAIWGLELKQNFEESSASVYQDAINRCISQKPKML
ncbi:hypothetical protein RF11_03217 [Thelohanellus kitauei]|uniref:Uncharacterized protein n=1 Tax=Thelohanellus kitauei TaxID=669202 RepID=A0A0C2I9X2_THEKT|nr:hypothetical protein RF11_03217 [Thelohanellus kitauei]